MAAYSVIVGYRDDHGQEFIDQSTVVYADSELEAKTLGATALNVPVSSVKAALLGGAGGMNPNSQIIGRQSASGVEILNNPEG